MGKSRIEPRYELRCLADFDGGVVVRIPLQVALNSLDVPVESVQPIAAPLRQRSRLGIARRLSDPSDGERPEVPGGALVISAEGRWLREGGTIQIISTATLVYGARVVQAAVEARVESVLAVVLLEGSDERHTAHLVEAKSHQCRSPVGTSTERLVIGTNWLNLKLEGEPFVVPTVRGYAPAQLVRRDGRPTEHILLGARSLSESLEKLRRARGGLDGARVSVRREGRERTAKYVLRVLD